MAMAQSADNQIMPAKRIITPFTPRVVDSTGHKVYVHPSPPDQGRKFIIEMGYGVSPVTSRNSFANRVASIRMSSSSKSFDADIEKEIGAIYLGFGYEINPWLTIGMQFSYSRNTGTVPELRGGRMRDNWFSFLPTVRVNWMRSRSITLYSRVAAGFTLGNRDELSTVTSYTARAFGWQLSPLGFEWSKGLVGLFVEGGYGMTGVASAGIRLKFRRGRDAWFAGSSDTVWEMVGR